MDYRVLNKNQKDRMNAISNPAYVKDLGTD